MDSKALQLTRMYMWIVVLSQTVYVVPVVEAHDGTLVTSKSDSPPNECTVSYDLNEVTVDCAFRSLSKVYLEWFPSNTTNIILNNNILTEVPAIFSQLSSLRRLNLAINLIRGLKSSDLIWMYNLNYLNLEFNGINLRSIPMTSNLCEYTIKELFLKQGVSDDLPFNISNVIGGLYNLTTLSIDVYGYDLYFDEKVKELEMLSWLTIAGSVENITGRSFENVPHLQYLYLDHPVQGKEFSADAMASLTMLDSLFIIYLPVGLQKILAGFKSLEGRNLTNVVLNRVQKITTENYSSMLSRDGVIDENSTKHLRRTCIREVTVTGCSIFVITIDAFRHGVLIDCLTLIDLSENPLLGLRFAPFLLFNMRNLQTVMIRSSLRSHYRIDAFQFDVRRQGDVHYEDHYKQKTNIKFDITKYLQEDTYSKKSSWNDGHTHNLEKTSEHVAIRKQNETNSIQLTMYLSPSLRYVDVARLYLSAYLGVNVRIIGGDNLIFLDLSDSGFRSFTGTFIGFTNLKALVLSGNDVSSLSDSFFDPVPTLEMLSMSNCNLNNNFNSRKGSRYLQNLIQLKQLDLSHNSLDSLQDDVFRYNNLTHLILSNNRFRNIPLDLKSFANLELLDVSNNAIVSLGETEMVEMDRLAANANGFQLILDGNILSCGCASLKFLQWIKETKVTLDNSRDFKCIDDDGELTTTGAFTNLEETWRKCSDTVFLSVSIVLFFVLVLGFVLCFFVSKYKIYIISTLMSLFGKLVMKEPTDYNIGVFIAYADKDYHFACHKLRHFIEKNLGLRAFVKDRDLIPTTDMATGIIQGIENSWRVLLVINKTFLNSDDWFLFICKSSIFSISPSNPNRVVVLVDENLRHQLPRDLLAAVADDNVITTTNELLDYEVKEKLRTRLTV
ncbi:toll-like receptor 4 [Physella acuta]|uniref:toll-like receptor 4 n=1 Tax=Physella acuta TaxID=109671 RepID=UPI0027DCA598|nr:toll-like receptor 4 [Physella acuta]